MSISQTLQDAAITLVKVNVGNLKPPAEVEQFMKSCVLTAAADLEADKITLDADKPDDIHLLAMYAAWLYRNRSSGAGKPEMLRSAMRNRQVGNVTREADA